VDATGRRTKSAARAIAERDRAADVDYLDTLLRDVRRHLPDCARRRRRSSAA
jgi:hypothetical protein